MMDRDAAMRAMPPAGGPISPSEHAAGYGPKGMMPGMPPRPSRFDQPPMGANYSPGGEALNEMGVPPAGAVRGGMRGAPMPPHEMMENMDEYAMDAKRRRY